MPDTTLTKITPRKYQSEIYESCKDKNCLVVLPTGIGKTLIALMLAINRQKAFPASKCLFLAPTRPLAQQHLDYFKKHLPELFADLQLFTGKIQAEQRKKIWQTADIIFSTPQCIDGETLIFTEDGPIKISDFFKKFKFKEQICGSKKCEIAKIKEKVLGYDGKRIGLLNASKAWKLPGEDLIKIKTEMGNDLLCTRDHPLLSINEEGELFWKDASLLNKGDYIASAKEIDVQGKDIDILGLLSGNESLKITDKILTKKLINKLKECKIKCSAYSRYFYNFMPLKIFLELAEKVKFDCKPLTLTDACGRSSPVNIPKQLDSKLTYILGAMLGDGHIGNRKSHGSEVVFSDLDRKSVCNEFRETIWEIFGIKMKEDKIKGLTAYNSALASILAFLGIPKGNKAKHIRVPKFLFFCKKELVNGFIKGIFDTDGHAAKYGVSISSASEKFILDLKWLFLKVGIIGNIEKRINRGYIKGRKIKESEIFTFRFSGRKNLQKFLEVSPNKEKCKKLIETLNNTKKPETRSKEILPISRLMKRIHKTNRNKAEYYKFSCLSIDNLQKLSNNLEGKDASKLRELLNLPLRWVKIKEKLEINGKKEVYDLTIEKDHNFIANWLVNHNCIGNDLKKNLYDLTDVSLLIEDECHRCLKNYAYTYVAEKYKEQAKNPRILGLTASPGSDRKTIELIAKNLNIEAIELRTRESEDVKEYLQDLNFEVIRVDFPEEFNKLRNLLKIIFQKKVEELKNRKLLFGPPMKRTILETQGRIMKAISSGNRHFNLLVGSSVCSQAIKVEHAIELVETQTLSSVYEYFHTLFQQAKENKSKAVTNLIKQPEFNQAFILLNELIAKKIEHPKLLKIKQLLEAGIKNNPKNKIIVFTQFRSTAIKISREINQIPDIKARVFVGQTIKKMKSGEEVGLSQKEQHAMLEEFKEGKINVLVATSIGEEGLDIPEVNAVIFYEPIPSAIRKIQRAGRTARLMEGSLIILITRDTRDEAYYYASINKEKKMYSAIQHVKDNLDLSNFAEKNKIKQDEEQKSLF